MVDPPVPAPWEIGLQPDWLLLVPASGQVLYRVIGRSNAQERDFQSDRDKKRPRYPDQTYVDHLGTQPPARGGESLLDSVEGPVTRVDEPG